MTATDYGAEISRIKRELSDPSAFLKKDGELVIMGNAPLEQANIIFLPEIHDDPRSLMTQLALIAREKEENRSFIVLDESLASLKKSVWDVFSQKTMEILAAQDQRREQQAYVPQKFELALQNLASKFRADDGQLNFNRNSKLWTLSEFSYDTTPFFGWDSIGNFTLAERNAEMVSSLKKALQNNDRVLVMAGARHVPELEFMTSQRLLCPESRFSNMSNFYSTIERNFGALPNLRNGIGATTPIRNYLANQRYAVVFNRNLYSELDAIVEQFRGRLGSKACLKLKH